MRIECCFGESGSILCIAIMMVGAECKEFVLECMVRR